ncbi:MAG: hypothetical protein VR64_14575 [Desulfatitalea sp. BRH_c12]|jgi:hypothetical protein|nr:MAG: hypothetical protein VR64_14575 [Desulfatitalea sp. BRH_c12]
MRKAFLISILIFFHGIPAMAEDGRCNTITVKEGLVYKIKAALYKGTHIQLPERLMFPPQGGSDLWTIEGEGHHVMVQPNSSESQGERTSLTLVTQSNQALHFEIRRVDFAAADTCVVIKSAGKYFHVADGVAGATYQTPEEAENIALQQRIGELQKAIQDERALSTERIESVISKYRSMIYTGYKWSNGMGFKGSDLVTDVWDDGRFTFVRVKADHRGMLAAKAEIDDKEEILEYKTDSDYVYKISGIYPKFILIYGDKNEVTISRRDNGSNGVY